MNRWYPKAKDALGRGDIDLESDDIRLQLLRATATYNAAHDFLDDLSSVTAGSPVDVGTVSVTDGVVSSALASVTVASVSGADVGPQVLVQWTGSTATSRLLAWIDTGADGVLISALTPDGDDIVIPLGNPIARL